MAGPELFYLLRPMATIKQAFINQLVVITQSPLKGPPSFCLIHMCIMYIRNMMPYSMKLQIQGYSFEIKMEVKKLSSMCGMQT